MSDKRPTHEDLVEDITDLDRVEDRSEFVYDAPQQQIIADDTELFED